MKIRANVPVSVLINMEGIPDNWFAWKSPQGRIFYYNGNTGLFTWDKPKPKPDSKSSTK
jgi:hypothetical protein